MLKGGSSSSSQGRPEPSTTRRPNRPAVLASRMLRMKGRLSSAQATSEEKRFRIRPEGVESKKVTGAWEKGCGWARAGPGRTGLGDSPAGEVGWGRKAQGREQEGTKVSPEFEGREEGQAGPGGRIAQSEKDRVSLSLWPMVTLRGHAGHSCTSVLDMPTPLSRAGS